jgi:hypothetical protein
MRFRRGTEAELAYWHAQLCRLHAFLTPLSRAA